MITESQHLVVSILFRLVLVTTIAAVLLGVAS